MAGKDLIGKEFKEFSFKIEEGKIKELCLAIGDENPIFRSISAAQEAGHSGIPMPLTFPTCFLFWGYPNLYQDMKDLGIDSGKILHLKQEYEYLSQIYAGTVVTGKMKITDVKTGKLNMVTFETNYSDPAGNVLLLDKMTIVVRPD